MSKQSYSQKKRSKLDYRNEYFKHNPGLFGCIWTCAYCHRPLIGKENVQVDHIIPLNSPMGVNARFNLVASCRRCNRNKSDKVDGRIIHGYFSKVLEIIVFSLQKGIIIAFVGIWVALRKVFELLFSLLSKPFKKSSIQTKLIALAVYIILLIFLCNYFK